MDIYMSIWIGVLVNMQYWFLTKVYTAILFLQRTSRHFEIHHFKSPKLPICTLTDQFVSTCEEFQSKCLQCFLSSVLWNDTLGFLVLRKKREDELFYSSRYNIMRCSLYTRKWNNSSSHIWVLEWHFSLENTVFDIFLCHFFNMPMYFLLTVRNFDVTVSGDVG